MSLGKKRIGKELDMWWHDLNGYKSYHPTLIDLLLALMRRFNCKYLGKFFCFFVGHKMGESESRGCLICGGRW